MAWHEDAVIASCEHYRDQLAPLPQAAWIQALSTFYAAHDAQWHPHQLAPLNPITGYLPAVNELTLGLGCSANDADGLIFGLEAAYPLPNLAAPEMAAQARISYLIEACALSALWRKNSEIATIALIAAGATTPAEWPASLPDWTARVHQFFRNPSHHYPVGPGHTWSVLARVAAESNLDQLFSRYYVLDLSHLPKKRNKGKKVSAARLSFLAKLVRKYGQENPKGKLWFHGAGWPVAVLHPQRRPTALIPAARATRVLMDAFFGEISPQMPSQRASVKGLNGDPERDAYFERYDVDGRSVIFSYHASGSTRVSRNYWNALAAMF